MAEPFYSILCIISSNSSVQDLWILWAFSRQTEMVALLQHQTYLTQSVSSLKRHKMEITHSDSNYCILGRFETKPSSFNCKLGVHSLKVIEVKPMNFTDSLTGSDFQLKKRKSLLDYRQIFLLANLKNRLIVVRRKKVVLKIYFALHGTCDIKRAHNCLL